MCTENPLFFIMYYNFSKGEIYEKIYLVICNNVSLDTMFV